MHAPRPASPSPLAAVILAELDDETLDVLAERLAPRLADLLSPTTPKPDGWFDTKGAAEYLGVSPNALHKHTSARTIPFHQDVPRGKCWFKRSDLDGWRQRG